MSGRGSVKKDASGRWMFVVDARSPDGKRRQIRRRGFGTKKGAQDGLNDALADMRSGGWVEPSDVQKQRGFYPSLQNLQLFFRLFVIHFLRF